MPFYHDADLKFEHLDNESIKKVIEDLKHGTTVHALHGDIRWNDLKEDQKSIVERYIKFYPKNIHYKYNPTTHTIEKIINAKNVVNAFLKISGYDRDQLKSGYAGKFVIHNHFADKAGQHFDLRLEFPVISLHKALKNYEGKRLPGTSEPMSKYPDEPGTVYRSFAVKKHTLPTGSKKLFIVETEDHPIAYGNFQGIISEGYGAGRVDIFDKGSYKILDVEGDRKYTIHFKGNKLNGVYSLIKYKTGYLWVKNKNQ